LVGFYERLSTVKEVITQVIKAAEDGGLFDVVLLDIKTFQFCSDVTAWEEYGASFPHFKHSLT